MVPNAGAATPPPDPARPEADTADASALLAELASHPRPERRSGYVSPLLAAQRDMPPFSVADMDRLAVAIQAATAAAGEIRRGSPPDTRRAELADAIRRGARARDELVQRCERMVRFRAARELDRRRAWGSSIPLADLIQDGMVGLLKGAHSYQPGRSTRDPLAYLALWVVQEIRRSADKADQDWDISTEMVEKFRRIRAIRSRLVDTLGRPPTVEEILGAANDPLYSKVGVFAGRNTGSDAAPSARAATGRRWEKLSERDIEMEARYRGRIGAGRRLGATPDEDQPDLDDLARPLDPTFETLDGVARVDERAAAAGLQALLEDCLARLDPPPLVLTIIEHVYGLHGRPVVTQRELARTLKLTRDVVAEAAAWFTEAMNQPGGAFYQAAMELDPIDRESLGLAWVETVLAGPPCHLPPVPDRVTRASPKQVGPPFSATRAVGLVAQYVCDADDSSFAVVFDPTDIPAPTMPCRRCDTPALLTRSRLMSGP